MADAKQSVRILLVEDNAGDAWIIQDAIKQKAAAQNQHTVIDVITEGESAVQRIQSLGEPGEPGGYHLLIADLNIPLLSGHEAIHTWRNSTHASLPVIVVTSSSASLDSLRAETMRRTFYFQKPMDLDDYLLIGDLVQSVLADPISNEATRNNPAAIS
jgi:CheY-like chemotaxis protein